MMRASGIFMGAAALGCFILQQQAELPTAIGACGWGAIVLLIAACGVARACRPAEMVARPQDGAGFASSYRLLRLARVLLFLAAGALAGFAWAAWRAELRLAEALDPAWEGRDVRVVGHVASLPVHFSRGTRFEFVVEAVETPGVRLPERLWLGFYPRRAAEHIAEVDDEPLDARLPRAGERWAWTVRLKRPHGSLNSGGFDYEAWLFEQDLRATGSVRAEPAPERLAPAVFWPPALGLEHLRERLRDIFAEQLGSAPYGGILVALAIGDQRAIPNAQWAVFNRTGTTHLMSISGLHVTLIAMLAAALVNRLWRHWPRLCLALPAPQAAQLAGVLGAFAYALLAGFGIPAQRTCLMLAVAALGLFSGQRVGAGRILLLALTAVLLRDPWAVLDAGFWLSFCAVAALLWVGLHAAPRLPGQHWKLRRILLDFGAAQWAATLATLPILLWIFQQFPLVSPLANLVAIPLVSFVITPLALAAAVLSAWPPARFLLDLAHALLAVLMQVLGVLADAPLWRPPAAEGWALVLAGLGAGLLLLPRGLPGRPVAGLMLLPILFWPAPSLPPGALRATVLDVGQGQAVLLETAAHRLLYDAGPRYGEDDAGRRVVLPYLYRRGIAELDMLVLSHRDSDHSGGFASIQAALPVRRLLSSSPDFPIDATCARGQSWHWDGVDFTFLHPDPQTPRRGDNGDSCVLKVSNAAGSLLLPGDLPVREEALLLARAPGELSADVLLMPHHGSNTSSSLPFVAAVGPRWGLASAGYRNRFGHPRPEVLERYLGLGAEVRRTDQDGALILDFADGRIALGRWREKARRYWHTE